MFLHEELRRAREQAGLSQAQLAARAGIPRNQIVRAEKGENITLDTLRKIVVHLQIDQLTLIETVQLRIDVLPQPEKLYVGAMETVTSLAEALAKALQLADIAHAGAAMARKNDPLREVVPAGGEVDPRLLFNRMQKAQDNLGVLLNDRNIA